MRNCYCAILLLLLFSAAQFSFGQFSNGIGYDLSFLNTEQEYDYNVYVLNENETIDLYAVNSRLGAISHGIMLRSFGGQFTNPKKVSLGYSLEIGYNFFSSKSKLLYRESSTNFRDSIVNAFDGLAFRTDYHAIRFDHFFDVHWNVSETVKITNSIGVGLKAIVSGKAQGIDFGGTRKGTIISTNHPLLRLQYQPQITERYKRFSLTYFAAVELFALPLFTKPSVHEVPDQRIPFSAIRFNSIGIRFIPHPKEKELPVHETY